MENDLTTEQIEKELAELIETSADKIDRQESEIVVCDGDDDRQESEIVMLKGKVKKDPKIIKTELVVLKKEEFENLSRRQQLEYKIQLSKNRTDQLKEEYRNYKTQQTKNARLQETKRLIILGRFLDNQFKREDQKVPYMIVTGHLDQYLTDDRDRELLGFPPLSKSEEDN